MKDIQATLRRIDEEIVGEQQTIARSQVNIMRLQETRLTLMRLVEDDHAAAEHAKMQRAGMIEGQHSRVLIVRKTGSGGEDGNASHAAKNGTAIDAAPVKKVRGKRKSPSASGDFRKKILALINGDTPMSSQEIGDHLGLPRTDLARKPMSNALYQLRAKGILNRDGEKRYSLAVAH